MLLKALSFHLERDGSSAFLVRGTTEPTALDARVAAKLRAVPDLPVNLASYLQRVEKALKGADVLEWREPANCDTTELVRASTLVAAFEHVALVALGGEDEFKRLVESLAFPEDEEAATSSDELGKKRVRLTDAAARVVKPVDWDEHGWHLSLSNASESDVARYVFVLDALNFCFWPDAHRSEYEHLAAGLTKAFQTHPEQFTIPALKSVEGSTLTTWFRVPSGADARTWCPPNLEARVRAIRELGHALEKHGDAIEWVKEAKGSAKTLVNLVRERLSMFRDEDAAAGLYFHKRSQILVADLWAAFQRPSESYKDIGDLTTFADYRVPQLMCEFDAIKYADEKLVRAVDERVELAQGSDEEIAIRSLTIVGVEVLLAYARELKGWENLTSVELDWLLWQRGEAKLNEMRPHHRVRTTFY